MSGCGGCSGGLQVLDHRVMIERPRDNPGDDGHTDLTLDANWQPVASRACRFLTKSGREGFVFQKVRADVSHIVEMRSDPTTRGILPTWRLKMGCRVFEIKAAYDKDEQKRDVWVECTEVK
jgi:head-tail adaptor